jgi:hypothetical protein
MIKVGIHAPVQVEAITMKEIAGKNVASVKIAKKVTDMLAALNAGSDVSEDNQEYVLAWPVDATKQDGTVKTLTELISQIGEMKGRHEEVLAGYFPKTEAIISLTENTGIKTNEDLMKIATDATMLAKVNASIYKQFVDKMAKADLNKQFQFKTSRKSKASHTSIIPRFGRFFASLDEVGVLKYTPKEIEGGWNSPDAVVADSTPSGDSDLPFTL